tara:strand:- start:1462 stop:1911 length:450 start_codon:yes stop_codon:yes gene_type:complete
MPFIGNPPSTSFQARPATQEFNGDGSTTTFTLNQTVTQEDIVVSVDGVVQESVDAYTVPNGTTLTFTAAPSSGTGNIFVIYLGTSVGSVTPAAQNKGNFKGGGLFRTNAQSLTADTTILATENANVTGPFTVASGVTLTVESGGTLVTL